MGKSTGYRPTLKPLGKIKNLVKKKKKKKKNEKYDIL
jgi:hypothetical protein